MADSREDIAISVKNVHKNFKLPHEKVSSIKSFIVQGMKKKDKGFEVQHALNGVSFDVKKGEFFGILGRNGSGKSTMLKMLAGIYQPTTGTIRTEGKIVPFIELGVGFNPELSGRENVYLNGALLGFTRKEIDEMYDDIVEFAELQRFMDQKLKNYSSGMQVRLAFSVATRAKADVLIVDEVLAVGDADFQKKCFDFFKGLKHTGTTVVFVTHDMSAVREYCDKAILIEKGVITHEGLASDVADEYLKLFMDTESDLVINEKERWGSGEVVLSNISHKLTDDILKIEFDIINKTKRDFEGLNIGVNFYADEQLVGGNGTKYVEGYEKGVSIKAEGKKHLRMEFGNILGNFDYSAEMSIWTAGNAVNLDSIKNAIQIKPLPTNKYVRFFKAIFPLVVYEEEVND